MEMDEYLTLEGQTEGQFKDKGSRFIAIALPAVTLDEIKLHLERLRKQYHDARHHCYAYRLGPEPYEIRYNDDGEPSGTAGKPIFGQLQSFGLTNVLIVVIRYFGGVKLGAGGLIQAYRNASRTAIENGKIIIKTWNSQAEITFEYTQMEHVMRIIKEEEGIRILNQEARDEYCIVMEIRQRNLERIRKKMLSIENLRWAVI
jgi:uncharacterized YigZ family protein